MELINQISQIWLKFINVFPPQFHALITSAILIGIIVSFVSIFMFNPIVFGILLFISIPILYPIVVTFFTEINEFLGTFLPKTPTLPKT